MVNNFIHDISAIRAHCEKVEADTPSGQIPDFSPVFSADFSNARSAANCIWAPVRAKDLDGREDLFRYRFKGKSGASIEPATQEGLIRANEWRGKNNIKPLTAVRDRQPQISINLYETAPETLEDDKFTLKPDAELPPKNDLGYVMSCLNTWFILLIRQMKAEGRIAEAPTAGEETLPGVIYPRSLKVCPLVQTHISREAKENAGKKLTNPIFRMRIKMDIGQQSKNTGMPVKLTVHDGRKEFTDSNGAKNFELLTEENGTPLQNNNIHDLIPSKSELFGIASTSSICFSSLGISMPSDIQVLVVTPPARQTQATVSDLFGSGSPAATAQPAAPVAVAQLAAPVAATAQPAAPVAATAQPAAPVAVAQPAAPVAVAQVSAEDVDNILADLAI